MLRRSSNCSPEMDMLSDVLLVCGVGTEGGSLKKQLHTKVAEAERTHSITRHCVVCCTSEQFLDLNLRLKAGVFLSLQSMLVWNAVGRL